MKKTNLYFDHHTSHLRVNWKHVMATACVAAAFSLTACENTPAASRVTDEEHFITHLTMKEARNVTGFSLNIPGMICGLEHMEVSVPGGNTICVTYSDPDLDMEVSVMKQHLADSDTDDADNSRIIYADEIPVSTDMENTWITGASWNRDEWHYTISSTTALHDDQILGIVNAVH